MDTARLPLLNCARIAGSAFLLAFGAQALAEPVEAPSSPAKELWQVEAPRPHVLDTCRLWMLQRSSSEGVQLLRADPTARIVSIAYEIYRDDVLVTRASGSAPAEKAWLGFTDKCFVLVESGKVLRSGAFVPEFSARALNIPVLILRTQPGPAGMRFDLSDGFPALVMPR